MIQRMTSRLPLLPMIVAVLVAGCDDQAPLGPGVLARATAATSLAATAYSHSVINLAWQDNATNETGWEVHRSTTGAAGSFSLRTTTGANVSSAGDGGLQGSTEYCYQVRSFRVTGRRTSYGEFSNVACATTLPAPVPAAPSGVNATPRYGYQIDLTWVDNSTDETGFRVERAGVSSGPWVVLATKSANVTSHTDYVPQEQQLCYRVVAVGAFGESAPSSADCTAAPAAPSNLAAAVSSSDVDLNWTDNSGVEDGFQVERSAGGGWSVVAALPANTMAYHDAGVPDGTYWYVVRATRDGGTSGSSGSVQVVVATTVPHAPLDANAVPQSSSSVSIGWVDGSTNEQGFRVERSTDGGTTWLAVASVGLNETGAGDWGVTAEGQVCYRVIAFNALGDSPPSNTDCTTPPAGPTDFAVTGVDTATIDFAWTDNSAVEDGYQVWAYECYEDYYYGYYCFLSWNVAVLGPNVTSFRFEGGSSAYWYTYVVFAVKDGGSSNWSDLASPTPPPGDSDAGPSQP